MKIFTFKYSRTVYGILAMILGVGFFVVPWLPIGYIFLFVGSLLLAHRIPALKKFINWLKEKDKKGRLEKVEDKVNDFFQTAEKDR